jgi:hypothetical protein
VDRAVGHIQKGAVFYLLPQGRITRGNRVPPKIRITTNDNENSGDNQNLSSKPSGKQEGEVKLIIELDSDTLSSVELLVEQASKADFQALKFMVSQ